MAGSGNPSLPVGIIPTVYAACDMDAVLCSVVSRYKPVFQKAIAYKVGEMAYNRLLISPRINDTTLNIDKDAAEKYLNTLVAKYRELVFGSEKAYGNAATIGLKQLVSSTYRSMADKCVVCTSQVYAATGIF
jgi:hypothetical protein